jgi:hypothetical protein
MSHSVEDFETRVRMSHESVKTLEGDDFLESMWRYIHHPYWTTPAEALLVLGMLEAIEAQAKILARMRETTLAAAAAIAEKEQAGV